jgi:hypothetical protein
MGGAVSMGLFIPQALSRHSAIQARVRRVFMGIIFAIKVGEETQL